ncbi:hypothetical protein FI667_g15486, partial [Globisporangium splendens]
MGTSESQRQFNNSSKNSNAMCLDAKRILCIAFSVLNFFLLGSIAEQSTRRGSDGAGERECGVPHGRLRAVQEGDSILARLAAVGARSRQTQRHEGRDAGCVSVREHVASFFATSLTEPSAATASHEHFLGRSEAWYATLRQVEVQAVGNNKATKSSDVENKPRKQRQAFANYYEPDDEWTHSWYLTSRLDWTPAKRVVLTADQGIRDLLGSVRTEVVESKKGWMLMNPLVAGFMMLDYQFKYLHLANETLLATSRFRAFGYLYAALLDSTLIGDIPFFDRILELCETAIFTPSRVAATHGLYPRTYLISSHMTTAAVDAMFRNAPQPPVKQAIQEWKWLRTRDLSATFRLAIENDVSVLGHEIKACSSRLLLSEVSERCSQELFDLRMLSRDMLRINDDLADLFSDLCDALGRRQAHDDYLAGHEPGVSRQYMIDRALENPTRSLRSKFAPVAVQAVHLMQKFHRLDHKDYLEASLVPLKEVCGTTDKFVKFVIETAQVLGSLDRKLQACELLDLLEERLLSLPVQSRSPWLRYVVQKYARERQALGLGKLSSLEARRKLTWYSKDVDDDLEAQMKLDALGGFEICRAMASTDPAEDFDRLKQAIESVLECEHVVYYNGQVMLESHEG